MADRYARLQQLSSDFLSAFNRADVDAIMAFFSDEAIYDEFHGRRNQGLDAIRKSFDRLFGGSFGTIRFDEEDTFIDASAGKVMSSWKLHLTLDGKPVALAGLDLIHFDGDKIIRKETYAKAAAGLYEPV